MRRRSRSADHPSGVTRSRQPSAAAIAAAVAGPTAALDASSMPFAGSRRSNLRARVRARVSAH